MISLNSDSTIAQPTLLKEGVKQIERTKISAKGVVRRIWLAQKYQVTLKFEALNQSQYQQIVNKFYGSGNSITYSNSLSGLSFTGFATASEAEYYKGASLLLDLDMTIVEA